MRGLREKFGFITIALLLSLTSFNAEAKRSTRTVNYDFTNSSRYAGLIIDASSGNVLYKKDADKQLHPASLTKMMTLYLTFQAIKSGEYNINDKVPVSQRAAMQPKTKLFLRTGQQVAIKDLIYGLIIHSANDASVVLAEAIAGNETAFATRMTQTARALGMRNTTFKNPHGLHHPEQVTTAYDMAKLAIALRRDFPQYYPMFSKKSFVFNGNIINSHNRVIARYRGADGLKTGFVNASGFNLVTTTSTPTGKLVGVVMGGPSASARDNHMIQLLDFGYQKLASSKGMTHMSNLIDEQPGTEDIAEADIEQDSIDAFEVAEMPVAKKVSELTTPISTRTEQIASTASSKKNSKIKVVKKKTRTSQIAQANNKKKKRRHG
jgi:D-alanyl-D-alanine carboxypeptidase